MRYGLISLLLIFGLAGCAQGPKPAQALHALNDTGCDTLIESASWQESNLYDLTYQCTPRGWKAFFERDSVRAEIKKISDTLAAEVADGKSIGPTIGNTFRALYMVEPAEVRAVIMGQDPAPQPGLATGLSFSLDPKVPTSDVASVQRVFLEAQNEGNCVDLNNGSLLGWADQGVLLLNMALTIPCPVDEQGNVGFCKIAGHVPLWQDFSHSLVAWIETQDNPMSYILWGSKAGQYASLVTNPYHTVLLGGHPSPKAKADRFFCKGYFKNTNDWLGLHQVDGVDWNLRASCSKQPACVWDWHSRRDGEPAYSSCESPCG